RSAYPCNLLYRCEVQLGRPEDLPKPPQHLNSQIVRLRARSRRSWLPMRFLRFSPACGLSFRHGTIVGIPRTRMLCDLARPLAILLHRNAPTDSGTNDGFDGCAPKTLKIHQK